MNQTIQESPGRYDHGSGSEQPSIHQFNACDAPVFGQNLYDLALPQVEARDSFKLASHLMTIEGAVSLRSRRLHGGASTAVEHSELYAGLINHASHQSAKRVKLSNEVAFGDTPDCRIAGHLCD
ncbi:MAG: hypothetical protein JMDDDDMK_03747 [Acidobacteria bacterium]|nr:hypothetical protein [Acidobacteriota bacterium]